MKFIAKIAFRINDGDENFFSDEQLHLIYADTMNEALAEAEKIGKREEEWIVRDSGEKILWEFIGVADLIQLNREHSLIYSFTGNEEGDDYIKFVKARHRRIIESAKQKPFSSVFSDEGL